MDEVYKPPLTNASGTNTDSPISSLYSEVASLKDYIHNIQNAYQVPPQQKFYLYTVPWNQQLYMFIEPFQSYAQ